jgi:hypothetical protein
MAARYLGAKTAVIGRLIGFRPISYKLDGSSIVAFSTDVNASVKDRDKMGILLSTLSLRVGIVIVVKRRIIVY